MVWMFFLFGLASMMGQILLLREILVIFHGTEIAIGIFYGSWVGGIGLGATCGAWLLKRSASGRDFHSIFLHALFLLGFSLIIETIVVRNVLSIMGTAPAEPAPLHGIAAAVPIANLLTAFLTGFLFPMGCRSVKDADDRLISTLYVFEGLGSLLGGLVFTFLLVRVLPPLRIASLTALSITVGGVIFARRSNSKAATISAIVLAVCTLVIISPLGERLIDWSVQARWKSLHPGLQMLSSEPTPYQQVEIARLGKQHSIFGNGKIVAAFPDPHTANRISAMIMAQKPDAKKILLIGGGIGSFVRALLQYPVEHVDVVEPDPDAFRIAKSYLPAEESATLADPRLTIIFRDGRFLVNRVAESSYDVIITLVPDPVSAFWNRYYTLEFFEAVSRALCENGFYFTAVTSAENFWGSEVASYAGSVYHTLRKVFASVVGTPGDETTFFASKSKGLLTLDPAELAARYKTLQKTFFDPIGFETILPPNRTAFVKQELERSPVLINTDLTPISSSLAMILWGRFSGTGSLEFLNTIRRGGLNVYLILIVFFVAGALGFRVRHGPREGRQARFQAILAMFAVGLSAMGVQIVLIYGYQSLFGYVFERVGLFAGVFMTGLVVGGLAIRRALRSLRSKVPGIIIILGLFAGLCLVLPAVLKKLGHYAPLSIELVIFELVFVSGGLTGAAFPLTASRHLELSGNAGETSGWIDAADHFGAALGAIITGTLLVPLLGTKDACLVLTLLLLVPAVLMLSEIGLERMESRLGLLRAGNRRSFPYVRTTWVLVCVIIAALTWHAVLGPPGKPATVKFSPEMLRNISGSERFTFHETPYPHYRGSGREKSSSTITLSTSGPAGGVKGYGGPINLLLSLSEEGSILGVTTVESKETPSYVRGLDEWLQQFRGRSVLKPDELNLDALTGATITCRAVKQIIAKTGREIAQPLLGLPVPFAPSPTTSWRSIILDWKIWFVVAILILFLVAFHSRSRILRLLCLAVSFLVLGVYLNAPFTSLDVAGLFQGRIPAAETPWRLLLFLSILVISALWGQAFCGFLCPFGALQEFLGFQALRQRASAQLETAGRYAKFLILALLLCLFLLTDDVVWFSFSPLQHVFRTHMDAWVLGLTVTVLTASLFYFRFWCRYLCPAGAFLALFNKVRLLRRHAPKTLPARCDLGVTFQGDVDCIRCHRCMYDADRSGER